MHSRPGFSLLCSLTDRPILSSPSWVTLRALFDQMGELPLTLGRVWCSRPVLETIGQQTKGLPFLPFSQKEILVMLGVLTKTSMLVQSEHLISGSRYIF